MLLPDNYLASLYKLLGTMIPFWTNDASQQPLLGPTNHLIGGDGPIFKPPHAPPDSSFKCDYSAMRGWESCSNELDRGCWLKRTDGTRGQDFTISTDYEDRIPKGIKRVYALDITEQDVNPDGILRRGTVANGTVPGPWIQACWGDEVEILVRNKIERYNGTTIHWHGVRQLYTFQNDGVNGVTQCPIPPGSNFTYRFNVSQYGSTWYHSHYSLQYAEGLVGPMTFYGPSSANYTDAIEPTLIADWRHNRAYADFAQSLNTDMMPMMDSALINGIGNYPGALSREKYTVHFEPRSRISPRRAYLMRLINTSVDTTWIFSIDEHELWVISSDFVPIHPYKTNNIAIGIGQRYHVVVEAKEFNEDTDLTDKNYWIRTTAAANCSSFPRGHTPDERQGILRYETTSSCDPTTHRGDFSTKCRDEPYESLLPIVKWEVPRPQGNNTPYPVDMMNATGQQPDIYSKPSRWAIGQLPLWLNFSKPTVSHIKDTQWDKKLDVIVENGNDNSWAYLLITGTKPPANGPRRTFYHIAHPIHLHGHDFALLQQSTEPYHGNDSLDLRLSNPPRRDVVLLPINGFVVIAFKTDNPGVWLLHCHIAWHSSSGLAMQILERASDVGPPHWLEGAFDQTARGCRDWGNWFKNSSNYWDPKLFQDDSGI